MRQLAEQSPFTVWNALLQRAGAGAPRLLLDLAALDANIARLKEVQSPERLRLVVKSLPAVGLLRYIARQLWGDAAAPRLMLFHLPFLQQIQAQFPAADLLLGKPLPLAALAAWYLAPAAASRNDPAWLVDTPARIEQTAGLAARLGRRLDICLELDIGMHRGGFATPAALRAGLQSLLALRENLRLRGFMGYDAHAARAPWPHSARGACARAATRFAALIDLTRREFGGLEEAPWCLNGAGSPTLSLHAARSPLNDFSIGSALLKPADFELPSLDGFRPAAWIAAPVLKRLSGVRLPFLEALPSPRRDALFIYGGRWMAVPAWPPGLRGNRMYGKSSNQQLLTIPRDSEIAVDDHVFLRPTQSEAVLLQFGRLLAVRGAEVETEWPPLRNELMCAEAGQP